MHSNRRFKITLLVSLILHVLLAFVWMLLMNYHLFSADTQPVVNEQPIVFEIEQNKPKTVIETPDDAKVKNPPEKADYLSDKNALARNSETTDDLSVGDPYAQGDFRVPELPTPQGPVGEQGEISKKNQEESQQNPDDPSEDLWADRSIDFKKDYLIKSRKTPMSGVTQQTPNVQYDNQQSRAPDMGGLSFNTYDWDFAPYMLILKRKVQGNIFPPPAFTRLGMISGETLLKFKIFPDGRVQDLQVLKYVGHKTLMETSVRAIEVSGPFPELPDNFPEDHLEVTAKFSYFIKKP